MTATSPAAPRFALDTGLLVRRLRLTTGLILLGFIISHFLNHAAGLISLAAMEQGRFYFMAVWRQPLAMYTLYAALLTHLSLGLWSLYRRRPLLRVPRWELAQLLLGLTIPVLLIGHVVDTHLAFLATGVDDTYAHILLTLWRDRPWGMVAQTGLLLVAWTHAMIGMHYWLRLKPWYPAAVMPLYTLAIIIPLLALLGFLQGGLQVLALAADPDWLAAYREQIDYPDAEGLARLDRMARTGEAIFLGLVLLTLAGRGVRRLIREASSAPVVRFADGTRLRLSPGMTLLAASRLAGRPHASVCGGRGRCSTCRVRIDSGLDNLPAAEAAEQRVLQRVAAPGGVRLACQSRPIGDVAFTPLLPPDVNVRDALAGGHARGGREQEVAILFADLRGFTKLSENRLPFDTVFLLNRYFAEMGMAVGEAGGRIDKFIGDGVMALFEGDDDPARACRQALVAAAGMGRRLAHLNQALDQDLTEPLRIAIGLHSGPVILGVMGYGAALTATAIGDAVNTASRLESVAKQRDVELVISDRVAGLAGIDLSAYPGEALDVRGRQAAVPVRLITRAGELPL
ncbi:MAG: adenylate/guanylate cyclase domain-containing protein [Alphaproteobacteria bacterium]|nr:adenylate/guanylate cyclase domain-containing protein [Alphaproteobacteria bacterium]